MKTNRKPCLDCGRLTNGNSRCDPCFEKIRGIIEQAKTNRQRNRTHYSGDYQRRARQVRATATICWICGDTQRPNDPWQADHVNPGDPNSLLLPAHRSCNIRRSNQSRTKNREQ